MLRNEYLNFGEDSYECIGKGRWPIYLKYLWRDFDETSYADRYYIGKEVIHFNFKIQTD